MNKIVFSIFVIFICCDNNSKYSITLNDLDINEFYYFILDNKLTNTFVIKTRCGLFSSLKYNDTILTIDYPFGGTFKYKIAKQTKENKTKMIYCNAEIVSVGHVDNDVLFKLKFDKMEDGITRIIMYKIDNLATNDTIYATTENYINRFKEFKVECEKKAK